MTLHIPNLFLLVDSLYQYGLSLLSHVVMSFMSSLQYQFMLLFKFQCILCGRPTQSLHNCGEDKNNLSFEAVFLNKADAHLFSAL